MAVPERHPVVLQHADLVSDPDAAPRRKFQCDHCGAEFEGEPGGAGLLLWTRGEEVRFEEPPLCEDCASAIAIGAFLKWETEEEDEG
jgi:hypothetical protein